MREDIALHYPDREDLLEMIPTAASIDAKKKFAKTIWTSDTCTTATRTRKINMAVVGSKTQSEQDCFNHLRGVFLCNPTAKVLGEFFSTRLKEDLDVIHPSLRVQTPHIPIARAFDKEFSGSANYAKGHWLTFSAYVRKYWPGIPLYAVECTHGARMDILFTTAPAMYMNRMVCLYFLRWSLSRKDRTTNILQRNLFVTLSSHEMVAQTRFLGIVDLSIMRHLRWFSGKSHELGLGDSTYTWGRVYMSKVLGIYDSALEYLFENPRKILSKMHMMGIFKELEYIPEYVEWLGYMFRSVDRDVVCRQSGARLIQNQKLMDELWYPKNKTNSNTDSLIMELVPVWVPRLREELRDQRKEVWKWMPDAGTEYSFDHVEEHNLDIGTGARATNDWSETSLGSATRNIQTGSTIGLEEAAGCSTVKRRGDFERTIDGTGKTARAGGIFHRFPSEIQEALVRVSQKKAPAQRVQNRIDLEAQRMAKLTSEIKIRENQVRIATLNLEKAVRYHKMWRSEACMKGNPSLVDSMLYSPMSDNKKREALTENIKIRTLGFGWKKRFGTTFSAGGSPKPLGVLGDHVKQMIKDEKNMVPPPEPHMEFNLMKAVPVLGTFTDERRTLDAEILEDESKLMDAAKKLSRERTSREGKDSVYWFYQPPEMPTVKNMIEEQRRIDIFWPMKNDDGTTEKQWCQGVVKSASADGEENCVTVIWDAMPDAEGWEEVMEDEVELNPSKWKTNYIMGWRMDVDIELLDNYYDSNHLLMDSDVFDEDILILDEEEDDDDEGVFSSDDEESDIMGQLDDSENEEG